MPYCITKLVLSSVYTLGTECYGKLYTENLYYWKGIQDSICEWFIVTSYYKQEGTNILHRWFLWVDGERRMRHSWPGKSWSSGCLQWEQNEAPVREIIYDSLHSNYMWLRFHFHSALNFPIVEQVTNLFKQMQDF